MQYIESFEAETAHAAWYWLGVRSEWQRWANGEELAYTNWARNEPSGGAGCQYGAMGYGQGRGYIDGEWNALIDGENPFICEWDDIVRQLGDVNGDGRINSRDASLVLRYDARLVSSFPAKN